MRGDASRNGGAGGGIRGRMSDRLAHPLLWPRLALIGGVRLYQRFLSPVLPSACRYSPSCSPTPCRRSGRYGALRGSVLAAWRILRCNPWGGHGYDPPRWFGEPAPPEPMLDTSGPDAPGVGASEADAPGAHGHDVGEGHRHDG